MIQGTGSNVGKSVLSAGIGRALTRRGLAVRPFKPQNMSNNAAVTVDGGEIGRAQALQARACRVAPSVHMNPVLLKPESETGAQIIVQGKRFATLKARDYGEQKAALMPKVLDSFARIGTEADLVIVEGAGSPAEVNLRSGDIANMGFALEAGVPVVLIGDIDRGGVIASLVGTHALLTESERSLVSGFVVNRFRGDVSLFDGGVSEIQTRTGWSSLGIVPWFADARNLPAEDALDLKRGGGRDGPIRIGVLAFDRIANFDDIDPLRLDPTVSLTMIEAGEPLPGDLDLVILPGSKATIADLEKARTNGWDVDLAAHVRRGGHVLGLCGGYQMLGTTIGDPDGIEGRPGTVAGLALLNVETVLTPRKATRSATGTDLASGEPIAGYEIHLGQTTGPDTERPVFDLQGRADGGQSKDGRIVGTYVHGLFAEDAFRRRYLSRFAAVETNALAYDDLVDDTLDRLADHLEQSLNIDRILGIARARA